MGRRATIGAAAALAALGAAAGWRWQAERLQANLPLTRADALLDVGRPDDARAALAARLARDPHDNRAWMLEARRRSLAGDLAGAIAAFAAIDEASPSYGEAQLRLGQAALVRHDAGVAEPAFRNALHRLPPNSDQWQEAVRKLLQILDLQGREDEGDALADLRLEHAPPGAAGQRWNERTLRDVSIIEPAERMAAARRYVEAHPADPTALGALATALIGDSRPEEAHAALAPVFAVPGPKPRVAWMGWTAALFQTQRFDELRAALEAMPPELREAPWALRLRAASLFRANDVPGALAMAERALAANPRDLAIVRETAAIAHRAGRPERAAALEQDAAAWPGRGEELRKAFIAWAKGNELRSSRAEAAGAAQRLADACAAQRLTAAAAYYREVARGLREGR